MKDPPVPTGKAILEWGSNHNPNEVIDFNPNYGFVPITVPSPVPAFGRKAWCYGPVYVCYIVGCTCIPLKYNWCHDFARCFATNILNLEATLLIKHAWPEVGERMKEASNLLVTKPDYLYRDLCVKSEDLNYNKFDETTGELITPMIQKGDADTFTPKDSSRYDQRGTGLVVGSKPALGTCMPRINTDAFKQADPTYSIPTNGNTAFSYYMNANNEFFRSGGDNLKVPVTIYGTSNRYLSTTFFLGGSLGCPDDISGLPKEGPDAGIAPNAKAWKEAATKCYDYFIFARATHPEWTLERPGASTDDPMTLDPNRGGNPELSIFNNCQPLMNGTDSRAVAAGLSPVGRGFAPVLQYQRPDLDEAEYSPREMMQRQYAFRFPGRLIPDFKDYFPCVKNMGDAGPFVRTNWDNFNLTLFVNYGISFAVETAVLKKVWGPQYFKPMYSGEDYTSRGVVKAGFCPNVEKINVPTNPFAPRNDIRSLEHPKGIAHPEVKPITAAKHLADLLSSGPKSIFSDKATDVYFTDREYSYMTSWPTPEDRMFHNWSIGYSDFNKLIFNPANIIPGMPSIGDDNSGDPGDVIGDAADQLGDAVDQVGNTADQIGDTAGKITEVTEKIQSAAEKIQSLQEKITGITSTVQGVVGKVQGVTVMIQNITGKIDAIKNKIEGISGPITPGAPGPVTTAIQNQITGIQNQVTGAITQVKTGIADKITGIVNQVTGVENQVTEIDDSTTSGGLTSIIKDQLTSLVDKIKTGIKDKITSTIKDQVSGLVDQVTSSIVDPIKTGISDQVTGIPGQIAAIEGQITGIQAQIAGMAPGQVTADIQAQLTELQNIKNQLAGVPGLITGIQGDITGIQQQASDVQGDVAVIQGDIISVKGDVADIQGNIADITGDIADIPGATPSIPGVDLGLGLVGDLKKRAKYPEVMCAAVPVDILEPRRKAFNTCIMERINFNYTTWRRRNFLSYYFSTQERDGSGGFQPIPPIMIYGSILQRDYATAIRLAIIQGALAMIGRDGTLLPWKKPCVTRFYETDTVEDCPVSMSIQQCCRIVVKDVVPMNYVKIRTCEGLRQKRDIIFGFDHVYDYAEKVSDSFKDDWAIEFAKTEEEKAKANEIIYTTTLDTAVPITSQGGKAFKTPTNQAEYDVLYTLNKKLTMVGCDNTEPDSYKFSTYFSMSEWKTLPASFTSQINKVLNDAQILSDNTIQAAINKANEDGMAGPIAAAWDGFNFLKEKADAVIAEAKVIADEAAIAAQLAEVKLINAQNNADRLKTPEGVALIANGNITTEMMFKIGQELASAKLEVIIRRGLAEKASEGYDSLKEHEELIMLNAEDKARDAVTKWLELRDNYILARGKDVADRALTTTFNTLKAGGGQAAKIFIDTAVNLSEAIPGAATLELVVSGGEGGAHMPYMRRWDTGTSAGNPLHGGSFINTLGSYDVIIGVGNEERTFNDATDTSVDVKTVQDQSEIAAAFKIFEAARVALETARTTMWNHVAWQIAHDGWGALGMSWDGDSITYQGARDYSICTLVHDPDGECQAYNNAMNSEKAAIGNARKNLAAAEAALNAARKKSKTDFIPSKSDAKIAKSQSLTQTAHIGRIDGWDGLKGHQMLSLRRKNLSCIGRYERLFQGEGAENFVLHRAGASYQNQEGKPFPWPLAWRGYIGDPNNEFEKSRTAIFGGVDNSHFKGLDNAQAGDIAIYTMNGIRRIAYISLVNKTNPQFVKMESWDQGKFPTSTGASLTLGTSIDRYVYKTIVPSYEKIDELDATKAAKINGQPSCEDPYYTSCIMGGTMDLYDADNEFMTTVPNSTWDDVIVYRPSLDTAHRQCPMLNTGGITINLSTDEMRTDSFSFCTNAGFDPPPEYVDRDNGYHGPGAGNISDSTICGPNWGSCKVYSEIPANRAKEITCFPGGEICSTGAEAALPAIPEDVDTSCTKEEYNEALKAYQEDARKVFDDQIEASDESSDANNAAGAANEALSDYIARSKGTIANAKVTDATNKANTELVRLNTALTTATQQLADAQAIVIPAPIVTTVNGVPTVTNQAEIDSATAAKVATISRLNTEIVTINANIVKQNNILAAAGNLGGSLPALDAAQAAAVAARNDLNAYITANPILDTMSDNQQKIIIENIARLNSASADASARVSPAIVTVNDFSSILDGLSPPNSTIAAQQAAANAEIQRLQGQANAAIGKADAVEEEAQEIKDVVVPKMACPYVPLDTTTAPPAAPVP